MNVITTFEFSQLTVKNFTYSTDFSWLLEQNFPCFHIERKSKEWTLKVRHYLGVIGLPSGQQLEILPKLDPTQNEHFTRQWVQKMLFESWSSLSMKPLSNLAQHASLPNNYPSLSLAEWLYQYFLQQLSNYHPNQQYQAIEKNQNYLQGKLLIKKQLQKNFHQPHKFFSQTQQFIPDTACNRLIKTAYQHLHKLQRKTDHNLDANWQHVIPILPNNYQNCYAQSQQELINFPTIYQHSAKKLINFCYWLLQASQPSITLGSTQSLTFLLNMNQAFEYWVSQKISQKFLEQPNCNVYQQQSITCLVDETKQTIMNIRPDLWIDNAGKKLVIDIKWKRLTQAKQVKPADIYQLMFYMKQLQAEQAWLVYPALASFQYPITLHSVLNNEQQFLLVPFCVETGELKNMTRFL